MPRLISKVRNEVTLKVFDKTLSVVPPWMPEANFDHAVLLLNELSKKVLVELKFSNNCWTLRLQQVPFIQNKEYTDYSCFEEDKLHDLARDIFFSVADFLEVRR